MPIVTDHPAVVAMRETFATIELEVLTGYTLADAMREGAGHIDQATGEWIATERACALGTAFLAAKARGFIAG